MFLTFTDRFKFLLEKALLQVKTFSSIISEAISGFYSDMKGQ